VPTLPTDTKIYFMQRDAEEDNRPKAGAFPFVRVTVDRVRGMLLTFPA
jgi:hypothetical protein